MVTSPLLPVTIRPAYADDEPELIRLAALDSAALPRGPLLVAEVEGELRVAVSALDLTVIADPFHLTTDLVELVRDHIARGHAVSRGRSHRRLGHAVLVGSLL
jgi:hypothetical protein